MTDEQIVLDAQLLILLAVGTTSSRLIEKHKNTSQFDADDFDLLQILLGTKFVLLLPNVVTEASNILRHRAPERTDISNTLARFVSGTDERYVASRLACANADYLRLGVTDAALILCSGQATLLSADLQLCLCAEMRGIDTINFNHERERYGLA